MLIWNDEKMNVVSLPVPGVSENLVSGAWTHALFNAMFHSTRSRGLLRGMHFQVPPHAEAKLVRCTRGSIFDVVIDLRAGSPTLFDWISVELSAENYKALYVPKGFAHGFLTLTKNSEIFYQMSEFYSPDSGSGVRWNDPLFKITWPAKIYSISQKDQSLPDYTQAGYVV